MENQELMTRLQQIANSNKDGDNHRVMLVSDEIFNQYQTALKELSITNFKLIGTDFFLESDSKLNGSDAVSLVNNRKGTNYRVNFNDGFLDEKIFDTIPPKNSGLKSKKQTNWTLIAISLILSSISITISLIRILCK